MRRVPFGEPGRGGYPKDSRAAVLACADEDDEGEEDKPKTKTLKETVWDWELLNDNKALWLRNPSDVSEQEYTKFFQALAKVRQPLR